ncbi:hypothetical protein FE784_36725 [Paenibacillus hemerocallicola]|uniref:Uncharacterized protein n=1 Tax=Paenibacillus hemerocallicola TaxID=1172614 RepID=A0A5C4SYY3_9BACL|nr:hypothetical protein [Paenibacillus hemerocallicola]TNJ59877.1 hypothetical protein FE784_36725 [Paenibacillus hemerocallicola]
MKAHPPSAIVHDRLHHLDQPVFTEFRTDPDPVQLESAMSTKVPQKPLRAIMASLILISGFKLL